LGLRRAIATTEGSLHHLAVEHTPVRVATLPSIWRHYSWRTTNQPSTTDTMISTDEDLGAANSATAFLRHTLATLAYRAAKPLRDAPSDFGAFRVGPTSRTAAQILAHMGDLMDWALTIAQNRIQWRESPMQSWPDDVARLFAAITTLDKYLASGVALELRLLEQIFQGPIADALTHTGQMTMLRRLVSAPIRAENYQRAHIAAGQTGLDQPAPQREFD
jgi:hypothetical protein